MKELDKLEEEMVKENDKFKFIITMMIVFFLLFFMTAGLVQKKTKEIDKLEQKLVTEKYNHANTKNEVVVLKKYILNECSKK